jgi:hypothetical protein
MHFIANCYFDILFWQRYTLPNLPDPNSSNKEKEDRFIDFIDADALRFVQNDEFLIIELLNLPI